MGLRAELAVPGTQQLCPRVGDPCGRQCHPAQQVALFRRPGSTRCVLVPPGRSRCGRSTHRGAFAGDREQRRRHPGTPFPIPGDHDQTIAQRRGHGVGKAIQRARQVTGERRHGDQRRFAIQHCTDLVGRRRGGVEVRSIDRRQQFGQRTQCRDIGVRRSQLPHRLRRLARRGGVSLVQVRLGQRQLRRQEGRGDPHRLGPGGDRIGRHPQLLQHLAEVVMRLRSARVGAKRAAVAQQCVDGATLGLMRPPALEPLRAFGRRHQRSRARKAATSGSGRSRASARPGRVRCSRYATCATPPDGAAGAGSADAPGPTFASSCASGGHHSR